MYTFALQHDGGVALKTVLGYKPLAVTSATGTISGSAVDRAPTASTASDVVADTFGWAKVVVPFAATIPAAGKVSFTVKVQDAPSSTGPFADYAFKDGSTVGTIYLGSTTSTASQTVSTVEAFDVDLFSADRYIRVQLGESVSTGTTNAAISATILLGGGVNYPVE